MPWTRIRAGLFAAMLVAATVAAIPVRGEPTERAGRFEVPVPFADGERVMTVHFYNPAGDVSARPILFIMHGASRNADTYRDVWIAPARSHGWVIVAPAFSKRDYPSAYEYNLANVFSRDGDANPPSHWAFSAIERIFAAVRRRLDSQCRSFGIYGHSAGAQFVHRMVQFRPDAPIAVAVAANAGWFTLPDTSVDLPFGMGGVADAESRLRRAFARKLVVLLGTADDDPAHPYLNRMAGAMAQGPHRLARGNYYFARARAAAASRAAAFNWQRVEVPGVGHSNRRMAPAAARVLARELRCE